MVDEDKNLGDAVVDRVTARGGALAVKAHFVTFFSPGTFFHEQTERPINSWDVDAATRMADDIVERHSATPFAFQFSTRGRAAEDLDSREIAKSGMYYLGGAIETLAEIGARNDPKEQTLLANMRGNDWDRMVVNTNSWRMVQPLRAGDVILDYTPPHKRVSTNG